MLRASKARILLRFKTIRKGRDRMSVSRRTLLKTSAASAVAVGIGSRLARAQAAEFSYKYAKQPPRLSSAEHACQGDGGRDQSRDQWAVRVADLSEQPARF